MDLLFKNRTIYLIIQFLSYIMIDLFFELHRRAELELQLGLFCEAVEDFEEIKRRNPKKVCISEK